MPQNPFKTIFETTFAKTDKTDAILVVDGRKLHVNKEILSCHSDYFQALFNRDFREKSMPEVPIEEVDYEEFATLLSLVQWSPIMPTEKNVESVLELAQRFLLPAATRHLEVFVMSTTLTRFRKLEIADKYGLPVLLKHVVNMYKKREDFTFNFHERTKYFTDRTKAELFDRYFYLVQHNMI